MSLAALPHRALSADQLARMAHRANRPWLDRLAAYRREGAALIARGQIPAGMAAIDAIAGLEPPAGATPKIRGVLAHLKTDAIGELLGLALAQRAAL